MRLSRAALDWTHRVVRHAGPLPVADQLPDRLDERPDRRARGEEFREPIRVELQPPVISTHPRNRATMIILTSAISKMTVFTCDGTDAVVSSGCARGQQVCTDRRATHAHVTAQRGRVPGQKAQKPAGGAEELGVRVLERGGEVLAREVVEYGHEHGLRLRGVERGVRVAEEARGGLAEEGDEGADEAREDVVDHSVERVGADGGAPAGKNGVGGLEDAERDRVVCGCERGDELLRGGGSASACGVCEGGRGTHVDEVGPVLGKVVRGDDGDGLCDLRAEGLVLRRGERDHGRDELRADGDGVGGGQRLLIFVVLHTHKNEERDDGLAGGRTPLQRRLMTFLKKTLPARRTPRSRAGSSTSARRCGRNAGWRLIAARLCSACLRVAGTSEASSRAERSDIVQKSEREKHWLALPKIATPATRRAQTPAPLFRVSCCTHGERPLRVLS